MDLPLALAVTAAVLGASGVLGLVLTRRSGRPRAPRDGAPRLRAGDLPGLDELGSAATLVQFSTEYCGGCAPARRQLSAVATAHDGVALVEIDLTNRGDLAREHGILTTPTVFLLDADGVLRTRFAGAPRREDLAAALAEATAATAPSSSGSPRP